MKEKMQLMLGTILLVTAASSVAKQCLARLTSANETNGLEDIGYWLVDCDHPFCDINDKPSQKEASKIHRGLLNEQLEAIMMGGHLEEDSKRLYSDIVLDKISDTRTSEYLSYCTAFDSNELLDKLVGD